MDELRALLKTGMLPRFTSIYPGRADCHQIAFALMRDLIAARRPGWIWCRAQCKRVGLHSWLENSGWAVDASNGASRAALIMRADVYRMLHAATSISVVLV